MSSPEGIAHRRNIVGQVGLTLVLVGGAAFFLSFVHRFYPIHRWLGLRYLGYCALSVGWAAACVSTGHLLVKRLAHTPLRPAEHVATSFAVGVLAFSTLMFVAGILGLLGTPLFVILPLGMIAAGAHPLYRYARRYIRHRRHLVKTRRAPSLLTYLAWAFGLLGLLMVYFLILTPENAQFDARWKHLALAEQYAHVGHIPRFPEGWTVATNPHMGSLIYTWAFLLPKARIFDKVELCAHIEFTVFLFSLATIPIAVRTLVPRSRAVSTWAVRFLFPGVFLYDSSLSCNADHIAGLYTIPIFLCLLRALRHLSVKSATLLALMLAGATMPKLTGAIMLLPVPAAAITIKAVWSLVRQPDKRKQVLLALTGAVGVGLLVTAPFWLKNWIWYGDPLYPSLHQNLTPKPWTPESADLFEWGYKEYQFWKPERSWGGLIKTFRALVNFSFVPNDYPRLHGQLPVFGSLFTLFLPALLFLKNTERSRALAGSILVSIFVWYWTHHQDRYLQTLVPGMAAVVAATLVLVWRAGIGPRIGASLLVGAQVLWAGDVYFIPTHAFVGSPQKKVLDLLAGGFERKYDERLNAFAPWVNTSNALPENARVLLHDNHVHLGLNRSTVSDWGGWQFGISYGRLESRANVHTLLKELGVTHVVWENWVSKGWDSLAGDLVFFDYALNVAEPVKNVGPKHIAKLPDAPPTERPSNGVVLLGCDDLYKDGFYLIEDLRVPVFGPNRNKFPTPRETLPRGQEEPFLKKAHFVVLDPACHATVPGGAADEFTLVAKRKVVDVTDSNSRRRWKILMRLANQSTLPSPAESPDSGDDNDLPEMP